MMKPEIKQKWIDALSTATYKQGKRCLRNNNDEFCCLGVLCDIYSKETDVEWGPYNDYLMEIEGCTVELPLKVMNWAGLESNYPVVGIEGKEDFDLTYVNDWLHYTFPQIAELIKEQL